MDFEPIGLLTATIIGGIIGAYIQHFLEKRNQISLEIRKITEHRYRSTLIFMRCFLKPDIAKQFQIDDPNFPVEYPESEIKKYSINKITEFYYNSLLYASDDVLICIKNFIRNHSEHTFVDTAVAMRLDIWAIKKQHKTDELILENIV